MSPEFTFPDLYKTPFLYESRIIWTAEGTRALRRTGKPETSGLCVIFRQFSCILIAFVSISLSHIQECGIQVVYDPQKQMNTENTITTLIYAKRRISVVVYGSHLVKVTAVIQVYTAACCGATHTWHGSSSQQIQPILTVNIFKVKLQETLGGVPLLIFKKRQVAKACLI